MDNAIKSSENEDGIVASLKKALIETSKHIFMNDYGLTIEGSGEITTLDEEYLPLNNISSSIGFHGKLVGTVILVVEKEFASHLLEQMGLGTLSPEEKSEYLHDSMGELLNIILGNTTNGLLDQHIALSIDTPAVFNFETRDVDLIQTNTWIYELKTRYGKCCLILKNT